MKPAEFDDILARTLNDGRISRGERRALTALLEETQPDGNALARMRAQVFAMARERTKDVRESELVEWLEDVVKILVREGPKVVDTKAYFSPGEACRDHIIGLLRSARQEVDICVFTITDDEITAAIMAAHRHKVRVRVLTDNLKSEDRGSDIDRLAGAGIPVVVDTSDHHMHHKFAVFDSKIVLTGSYNWTRSAASRNEENIVITEDPRLARTFLDEFDRIWARYAGHS